MQKILVLSKEHQPTPLDFNLQEIEGFRYRVEDVSRAVTKMAVRETKLMCVPRFELGALTESLKTKRLTSSCSDMTESTQLAKVQDHLKHVPKYLLPRGMQV
jgi:ATP-dependent RNA helicase DDX56/DBP9